MAREIELGHRVKDKVTGIKGHVIQKATWLTGCDTVAVEPDPVDGKRQDAVILDINRVKYVDVGVRPKFFSEKSEEEIEDQPVKSPSVIPEIPVPAGGPHEKIKDTLRGR